MDRADVPVRLADLDASRWQSRICLTSPDGADDPPMFNVVLVEPEIPPNTGNVGRLCLATRSTLHLVGPLGFSIDDRQLKRAGLDYWNEVDVREWSSLDELRRANASARFFYLTTKATQP
jgi:tRNA (cytidine/uridine-2'-O-)-methyltransferase